MKKVLTPHQIRVADAFTIENEPVSSIDLMERAAKACVDWIVKRFGVQRKIAVFAGPGNNGGDGLAIARMMHAMGYDVSVFMLTESDKLSPDCLANYQRLRDIVPTTVIGSELPELSATTIVIDALFGVGLRRSLDGIAAQTVAHINKSGCTVVAVDMPSGMFCDDNTENNPESIIRARYTLTFQQPKLSFFFAENDEYVGEWTVLDIGLLQEAIEMQGSKYFVLQKQDIAGYIQPRKKFAHKGNFGHACLAAGSHGMMGACILAARACLRTGVGLVTARIPIKEKIIMQTAVPEAIVSCYDDQYRKEPLVYPELIIYPSVNNFFYSAIAIGPGLLQSSLNKFAFFLFFGEKPLKELSGKIVLDAGALNIFSEERKLLKSMPLNSILTPHPKEFDRLFGNSENGYLRHLKQIKMAKKHSVYIVLKGAYTSIATPDGRCFFNTTGNPGMATAGSGDVLTGMILSLLAQGLPPLHAACAGVWLHGAAGDLAAQKMGQQALIASDIIDNIGKAFEISPAEN